MYWLAVSVDLDNPASWLLSVSSGLKLLSVVVVLDAVIIMFISFCNSRLYVLIMLLSVLLLAIYQSFYVQIFVLFIAMLIDIVSNESPAAELIYSSP
jgi:chromate transporter